MLRVCARFLLRLPAKRLLSAEPAAATGVPVDKELLMKLRKRTGYSFVNCRKALVEFGPERLKEAEAWLHKQAAQEGWTKATKVGAHTVNNGLVAVLSEGHVAAIVEMKCETDFVAKNIEFKKLVEDVSRAALIAARKAAITKHADKESHKILRLDHDPQTLKMNDGSPLNEAISLTIGKLKENIVVTRVQLLIAEEGVALFGCAHPRDGTGHVDMGQYIALIGIRRKGEQTSASTVSKIAHQLCQHIIGMRSATLGTAFSPDEIRERERSAAEAQKKLSETAKEDDEDELNRPNVDETASTHLDETETAFLRQPFMFNPTQTVGEFASELELEIVDFVRTECGQEAAKAGD